MQFAFIFKFLDMEPISAPTGNKGKAKMKKIFRAKGHGCAYHAGERAEDLINALDLDKIISNSPVPLHQIHDKCFDSFR